MARGSAVDTALQLQADPTSVREARAELRRRAESVLPADLVDNAELLVSEVVTNAVRHGGPDIRLRIDASANSVTVYVYDSGEGAPTMGKDLDDTTASSGRGLLMVDRIANRWGIEAEAHGGKTVWFTLGAEASSDAVSEPRNDEPGIVIGQRDEADGGRTLIVSGAIDVVSRDELLNRGLYVAEAGASLALDLEGVTFIDSSGVSALIQLAAAARNHGGGFSVPHRSARVERIFEMTGLESAWNPR